MTKNNSSQPDQPSNTMGPGDKLQAARISIGLTIEDVANKMHLSESILSSLEDNDFDDITAPIFVKGYLRSYARIVNVDENDIIQQYTTLYTDGDPPITSTSNTSPEINSGDTRVKWITWLIIIGLLGLLSAWWWTRYHQPAQPLSLDSQELDPSEAFSAQNDQQVPGFMSLEQVARQADKEAISEQAEASLSAMSAQNMDSGRSVNPVDSTQPDEESAESSTGQQGGSASVEAVISESGALSEEPSISPTEMPLVDARTDAPENPDKLVVTVNADTWTDIRDADGNKLIYDLLKTGEEISVAGKTPLRVFFGNGYGVSVQYQGKEVDLSGSIRADNTARVVIGQ